MKRPWQYEELFDLIDERNLKAGILITVDENNILSTAVVRSGKQSDNTEVMIGRVCAAIYPDVKTANDLPI
jgi:hypothetical protein